MIRTTFIAVCAAAAFAAPALAADTNTATLDTRSAAFKGAATTFTAQHARVHLAKQGYVNISPLARDTDGTWRGTAVRDGKTLVVAVGAQKAPISN